MSRKTKQFLAVVLSLVTVLSCTFAAMAETMPAEGMEAAELCEAVAAEAVEQAAEASAESAAVNEESGDTLLSGSGVSTYSALQEAINSAPAKEEVEIAPDGDITDMTSYLTIPQNKVIVLDLNGKTLDRGLTEPTENGMVIFVEEGAKLTIKDSSVDADGTVTGGYNESTGGGIVVSGELILESGNITGNTAAGGAGVLVSGINNAATFTMNGGKIAGNTAEIMEGWNVAYGGGVLVGASTKVSNLLIMNGGEISGNSAKDGGGVTIQEGGDFYMVGGTITKNVASDSRSGGVLLNYGSMHVGETAMIQENTGRSETANVLLFYNRSTSVIGVLTEEGTPSTMSIGVTSDESGTKPITGTCAAGSEKFFTSDDYRYLIQYNSDGGFVQLAKADYTVTFNYGGKAPYWDYVGVMSGSLVTEPEDPSLPEYVFLGWYKEPTFENEWNFETDTVTKDTMLYAKWDGMYFPLTFMLNETQKYTSQQEKIGTPLVFPAEPTREGFVFDGWWTKASGGTAIKEGTVTEKFIETLYAHWKGDVSVSLATEKSVYTEGETVTFTARTTGIEDGTYPMSESLDGNALVGASISIKDGTGTWSLKRLGVGKHTVEIVIKGAKASVTFEVRKQSDPTPGSDDDASAPLFTGTWANPVKAGKWSQDANGVWHYTSTETFRATWGYIVNPYAQNGQNAADWFWFDANGNMLTGWQLINGKWYYLNPTKDGTLGACLIGPARTPDGYEVDESGAWTGR